MTNVRVLVPCTRALKRERSSSNMLALLYFSNGSPHHFYHFGVFFISLSPPFVKMVSPPVRQLLDYNVPSTTQGHLKPSSITGDKTCNNNNNKNQLPDYTQWWLLQYYLGFVGTAVLICSQHESYLVCRLLISVHHPLNCSTNSYSDKTCLLCIGTTDLYATAKGCDKWLYLPKASESNDEADLSNWITIFI